MDQVNNNNNNGFGIINVNMESKSHQDSDSDSDLESGTMPGQWTTDISIDGLGVVDCIDYGLLNGQADVNVDVDVDCSDSLLLSNNDSAKLVSVRFGSKYFKDTSLKLNESLVH